MRKAPKRTQQAEKIFYRTAWAMELARGSSHISSTLSADTRRAAIAEVLDEFALMHGADKLDLFRELLAENLDKRDKRCAAQAVLKTRPLVMQGEDGKSRPVNEARRTTSAARRTVKPATIKV